MTTTENATKNTAGTCTECGGQPGALFVAPSKTFVCARCAVDGAARTSRRWARLRTAGIVLDIVLTAVLLGDIAVRWGWGSRHAPAGGPGTGARR